MILEELEQSNYFIPEWGIIVNIHFLVATDMILVNKSLTKSLRN